MPLMPLARALELHRARTERLALGAAVREGEGMATPGFVTAHALAPRAGCTRLDIVAGAPLGRFRAELWSDDARLIDRSEGGATATLFACQTTARPLRVEVSSLGERGPYVLESRLGEDVPSLSALPRAAARVFQQLEAIGGPIDGRAFEGVTRLALDGAGRYERLVALRSGCTRFVVAVEEATPLAVELVSAGGEPLHFGRGTGVVALEACRESALRARLRLRADGAAEALLHTSP
jgi:hypothetical protein